jgi:hypothetical protein
MKVQKKSVLQEIEQNTLTLHTTALYWVDVKNHKSIPEIFIGL